MERNSGEMRLCSRCEKLPARIDDVGRLYTWFPLGHTLAKATSHLRKAKHEYQLTPDGSCTVINCTGGGIRKIANDLAEILSGQELKDSQVLLMKGDYEPDLNDFPRVISLHRLAALSRADWLLEMLSEERITSHFQPIVHAQDTSHIFAQEALLRGIEKDGTLVSPGRIFALARDGELLFLLDSAARRSAIREAGGHGIRQTLFVNFTPGSIYDPAYCLRTTIAAVDSIGVAHSSIVFEVIESEQIADAEQLRTILDFYRQNGFRVALDDVGAGYSNLNLVHQLRPDFIKLDTELTRDVHKEPYKAVVTDNLVKLAQRLNIRTIAEGIEHPDELQWVREHGVDFVQGYLIAKPASPPLTSTPKI